MPVIQQFSDYFDEKSAFLFGTPLQSQTRADSTIEHL